MYNGKSSVQTRLTHKSKVRVIVNLLTVPQSFDEPVLEWVWRLEEFDFLRWWKLFHWQLRLAYPDIQTSRFKTVLVLVCVYWGKKKKNLNRNWVLFFTLKWLKHIKIHSLYFSVISTNPEVLLLLGEEEVSLFFW